MLQKAVKWNVNFITKILNITDKYEVDRIRYGVETLLGESLKTLIIFLLSLLIGKGFEFCIVSILMILFRSNIGGTHAKSYLGCLIKTSILFCILFYLGELTVDMPLGVRIIAILFIVIILNTVKYKTRFDESGSNEELNIKFRIKLLAYLMISIILCEIFFKSAMSLLIITMLYIVIDYMYMKRSVGK